MTPLVWIAAFFFVLFVVRVLMDPRAMRAGVYLMLAVTFLVCEGLLWLLMLFGEQDRGAYILLATLGLALLVVLVLTVMLLLNGVTMLRREGRSLGNTLSLAVGLLFLAEIIGAVVSVFSSSTLVMMWTLVLMVPTAYLAFGFLSYAVYSFLYQQGTRLLGRPVTTVVVLGSGLIDGRVPPLLASRLDRGRLVAASSAARGSDPVIVVSGGKGSDEVRPEAAAMAEYLVAAGVASDKIIEEDRSRNTEENIVATELVLAGRGITGRAAVVTNNFHAFRSALLMREHKMKGYVIGAPTAAYYWPSASIREFAAIIRDHPWFTIITLGITWVPILITALIMTFS